jgi:precorrin-4/cobalt-precorrin-4 C11-methyltransferase
VISFVGAGPGAADLITLRGRDRLAAADVVVWASSLVPEALLAHTRTDTEVHDSAGMTLEDVLAVYAARPEARIVRLHSGDPVIYGAIQEQLDWCVAHERDFEIVPGVSSLGAAAAALGRELTIPAVAQSVVLTRLGGRTAASMPARESVAAFAAHGTTMAVFLSAARPVELQRELLAAGNGYAPDTPAAVVVRASWPDERSAASPPSSTRWARPARCSCSWDRRCEAPRPARISTRRGSRTSSGAGPEPDRRSGGRRERPGSHLRAGPRSRGRGAHEGTPRRLDDGHVRERSGKSSRSRPCGWHRPG